MSKTVKRVMHFRNAALPGVNMACRFIRGSDAAKNFQTTDNPLLVTCKKCMESRTFKAALKKASKDLFGWKERD